MLRLRQFIVSHVAGASWERIILLSVLVVLVAIFVTIEITKWNKQRLWKLRRLPVRTRSDMRHVATAIESFRGDHEQYPESTTDPSRVVCQLAAADERPVSTFAVDHLGKNPLHLTTPVGYLATYWPDPCATQRAGKPVVTFGYYTPDPKAKDSGWILFSPGPDGKFDLDWTKYDPKKGVDQTDLYNDTFDPTNGTVSHGDIWRVKQ